MSRLSVALVGLAFLGCGSASKEASGPCTGTGACPAALCVAGRCRVATVPPAKSTSARVVLLPRDFAVLTASGGDARADEGGLDVDSGDGASARTSASARGATSSSSRRAPGEGSRAADLPEAIALGRADTGRAVLLFRFASTWPADADIESAYFVMDVIEGSPLPLTPPTAEIARILSPWSSATTSWGRQPRLGLPEPAGTLRVLPSVALRLDVTPAVRAWARRERDDHGLALLVDGSDPNGVLTSTGLTQGLGPHLEVYLK